MSIPARFAAIVALCIGVAGPAHSGEDKLLSLDDAKAALAGATFDCTMSGGVVFRLYFPDEISGDQIDYRFKLAGETDRRPMTYRIEGEKLVSARDGEERVVYNLGSGDVRIARPGEDGAVCRSVNGAGKSGQLGALISSHFEERPIGRR